MSRRRKNNSDAFLDEMVSLPWWASIVVGGVCWIVALLVLAWFPEKHPIQAFRALWWVIPGIFGMTAIRSLVMAGRARISLGQTKTLRELQAVPWDQFERLSAAYYRARGYSVVQTGQAGPDGGFDLVLRKDGERILVQCKKYVRDPVGVSLLREFFGVVVSEGAHRGIFITTSDFTPDAREFGLRHANLELIPGRRFAEMVQLLHSSNDAPSYQGEAFSTVNAMEEPAPCCPKCKREMIQRTAKSGRNAGEIFWGCHGFPACRGTRPMLRAMTPRQ
jgi:restriction system protein